MKRSVILYFVAAALPGLFAGCALAPAPVQSQLTTPAAWKEPSPPVNTVTRELPLAWWRVFADPELNALEVQVIAANQDLQQAMARVAEARALAGLSAADRYPTLSLSNEATRQRLSTHRPNAAGDREFTEYRTGFDLGYEVDLWGRNHHAASAATSEAWAEEHDFHAVLLALTADTACTYHEIRAFDTERQTIEATRQLRRESLNLQTTRHQAGLIDAADVARAQTELAEVEAGLHGLDRSRARLEHALAVLCGESPSTFAVVVRTDAFEPPSIPVGLPSELLEHRPDIAAAAQRLEAAGAEIAVAKADFFPRISLTGSAGLASADLSTLARNGSGTWSFGPSLYIPLLDGGRNRAHLTAAEARYQQSTASYRDTVLTAFREVEDSLSDLATLSRQAEAVDRQLASARDTASFADERYHRGLTNYLDVVDAQRGVHQAERSAAQLRGQQATATILLIKALGGGWAETVSDIQADN